jgi:hypothetical protein
MRRYVGVDGPLRTSCCGTKLRATTADGNAIGLTVAVRAGVLAGDRATSWVAALNCCCFCPSVLQQSLAPPRIGHLSWPALQQAICPFADIAASAIQLPHADIVSEVTSINTMPTVSERIATIRFCACCDTNVNSAAVWHSTRRHARRFRGDRMDCRRTLTRAAG